MTVGSCCWNMPPRLLNVQLRLTSATRETDQNMVGALRDVPYFNGINLVAPSLEESPRAIDSPFVQEALCICRVRGLTTGWMRRGWNTWPPKDSSCPLPYRAFDPVYYAGLISAVSREAAQLNVDRTGLDMEPYGRAHERAYLKDVEPTPEMQTQIRAAIALATSWVGQVDTVMPCSSTSANSYAWLMAALGQRRMCEKTYYATHVGDLPVIVPLAGMAHQVHLWGSAVGVGGAEEQQAKPRPLLPREIMALDLSEIRGRFPECVGTWVWGGYESLPRIMRAWPEPAGPV